MTIDESKNTGKQHTVGVQVEPIVRFCRDCRHWEKNTHWDHEGAINAGYCSEKLGIKVNFELSAGWGGVVDKIETEEDFSCANYNIDLET